MADRGEFESHHATELAAKSGVTVELAAPYRGDQKGSTEKKFDQFHIELRARIAGMTEKKVKERGDIDHRRDAILTVSELTSAMIAVALYLNNHHELVSYPLTREMVRDHVPPIPAHLWRWCVERGMTELKRAPVTHVEFAMLPVKNATVTAYGYRFQNLYYKPAGRAHDHHFDKARQDGVDHVAVSYHPLRTNNIYLHDRSAEHGFVVLELTDRSSGYADTAFADVGALMQSARAERSHRQFAETEGHAKMSAHLAKINAKAMAQRKHKLAQSDLSGIKQNRTDERERERAAREGSVPVTSFAPTDSREAAFEGLSSQDHEDDADNPYICALPPILAPRDYRQAIAHEPLFDETERALPHELRYHCVLRLKRFFHVGRRQVEFARGFDAVLRQGYLGRDASISGYEARQLAMAEAIERKDLFDSSKPPIISRSADSAFLMGVPGMGKSLTVNRVLARYPQVIRHATGETQIVWLKLECPPRGSIRALCLDFFEQVDELLGQRTYQTLYAGANASEDSMMSHMALVANRHSLGCLIVDEIQHLGKSHLEEHLLMTFLTALINKIGVPLLCIGTMSAYHLIERTGRMGRRAIGLAHAIWGGLQEGEEWRQFVTKLWRYQWTAEHTPLDDALLAELYNHTQGIIDLVIKLFMAVQFRLIDRNQTSGGKLREIITPEAIAKTAEKHFGPVKEMLAALRSKDMKRIRKFDDLTRFDTDFALSLNEVSGSVLDDEVCDDAAVTIQHRVFQGEAAGVVRLSLRKTGHDAGHIDEAMKAVFAELGEPDFVNLSEFLKRSEAYLNKSKEKRPTPEPKVNQRETYVEGDLRKIAEDAKSSGKSVSAAIDRASVSKAA